MLCACLRLDSLSHCSLILISMSHHGTARSCVNCVQYIVHWAFGDPYCLYYFELELWLHWLLWLRAAAPAALAAPAASPAFNILFIGLLGTHTAYSTSNWSSGCAGCVG